MYYDKNRRYFENKRLTYFLGLGFIAAALILFFVWPVDQDNYRIITMSVVPVLIVGCVLFFGSMLRRSSEHEIDEDVDKMLDGFEQKAYFDLDMYDNELPYVSSVSMECYNYFDTPYVRRDGQGVYRTDHYVKTLIYFKKDTLCTASRTVHLVDEGCDDVYKMIPYSEITDAKLEKRERTYTVGKKEVTIVFYEFNVYCGEELRFSAQTRYDYTVECAIEDIKKQAKRSRE